MNIRYEVRYGWIASVIGSIILDKTIKGKIFLVGCPRSGTTLLQSLLGAHPQIASFPESHLFQNLRIRYLLVTSSLSNKFALYS